MQKLFANITYRFTHHNSKRLRDGFSIGFGMAEMQMVQGRSASELEPDRLLVSTAKKCGGFFAAVVAICEPQATGVNQ
ncbi:hypothetical protein [Paracidovorax valerianellae]|uniref:hypothetical protein n=1 Tax=Paracidovorax valerianellae TaxID=187868 RepID=UPI0011137164|nr:hypothetical protein [Paracidovorax valerianellae]MDA8446399.1 hypothetical protein [Paracidovorax valerianellae]